MPYIPNSNMESNFPDDNDNQSDKLSPDIRNRRSWIRLVLFLLSCFGLFLAFPPIAREFTTSGGDINLIAAIFSSARAIIGIVILIFSSFVSILIENHYNRRQMLSRLFPQSI